jgi:hypothetical protein
VLDVAADPCVPRDEDVLEKSLLQCSKKLVRLSFKQQFFSIEKLTNLIIKTKPEHCIKTI